MIPEERRALIESYGQAYGRLAAALERFPPEARHFRPAPDQWTIHEIIVHITDSEVNSYVRCRRAVAEPGREVMAYDEWRWAQELDYAGQSAATALELFRWLRQSTWELIRGLPEAAWGRTLLHPENGRMTLDDWLGVYERHVPEHITQMEEVLAAWEAARQ